jgi:sorbitol-specific phosphotransferase system component IIC
MTLYSIFIKGKIMKATFEETSAHPREKLFKELKNGEQFRYKGILYIKLHKGTLAKGKLVNTMSLNTLALGSFIFKGKVEPVDIAEANFKYTTREKK